MSGLRTGYTTGACAAAAAKAAAMTLLGMEPPARVEITLANGAKAAMDIVETSLADGGAVASVIKDAGDDPDVTHGAKVTAQVSWMEAGEVEYEAGEGVGTVTRKGLCIPPGSPAINPGPRMMIASALRDVTGRPARVRISIPGGRELACKTFNPRLGVEGGLSILGTTGIVRPYSIPAMRQSIACALDVAMAEGGPWPAMTPGNIGSRAATALFGLAPARIVEAGNEWGFVLEEAAQRKIDGLLMVGHPGKLAKLAMGVWDTHSKSSDSAAPFAAALAERTLGRALEPSATVEGLFEQLDPPSRKRLGEAMAQAIRMEAERKSGGRFPVAVALVNMKLELLGGAGDTAPWKKS